MDTRANTHAHAGAHTELSCKTTDLLNLLGHPKKVFGSEIQAWDHASFGILTTVTNILGEGVKPGTEQHQIRIEGPKGRHKSGDDCIPEGHAPGSLVDRWRPFGIILSWWPARGVRKAATESL